LHSSHWQGAKRVRSRAICLKQTFKKVIAAAYPADNAREAKDTLVDGSAAREPRRKAKLTSR